ncbi:hypothetical protein DM806_11425 [Sphingobium lactosutens]|nr:hypothetical protein [Sphingobium lactosutens]
MRRIDHQLVRLAALRRKGGENLVEHPEPAPPDEAIIKGMMWMARTGLQWRHLPDEYGKWNSAFRRYRRWVETGGFDAMLETLAEMGRATDRPI